MELNTAARINAGMLSDHILDYLREHHNVVWSVLIEGRQPPAASDVSLQDLNDLIYGLYFLDWPVEPSLAGVIAFADHIGSTSLAGGLNRPTSMTPVNVHGTAYALSAMALLKSRGHDLFDTVITSDGWLLDHLIDPVSLMPKWPAAWSHHNWRVSHWVGGSISIVNELARHMPMAYQANQGPEIEQVLAASDRLIDERSGVIKCYRSRLLQFAFRQAYRLRHDPMLGDIGGVVHIHWANYANGRAYKSNQQLFDRACQVMLARHPFMETVPYCLDFDIVQIVRTSLPEDLPTDKHDAVNARAKAYAQDILTYLAANLKADYALHKLPGALATLHECALINPEVSLAKLGDAIKPKDIMSDVSWL